jgi:uncharacterized protein YqgV (UPF0045/DUF77 family)
VNRALQTAIEAMALGECFEVVESIEDAVPARRT